MWRGRDQNLPDSFGRPRRGPPPPGMDGRRDSFGQERRRSVDDDRRRGRDDRYDGPPRRDSRDFRDIREGPPDGRDSRGRGSRDDAPSPSDWPLHLKPQPEPATDDPAAAADAAAADDAVAADGAPKPGSLVLAGVRFEADPPVELSFWQSLQEQGDAAILPLIEGAADAKLNELGGPYGSTPLGWVCFCGRVELVRALLERKASVSLAAEKGSTPLHMAVWNGDHEQIVQMLLDAGADPSAKNKRGETALVVARKLDAIERGSPIEKSLQFEAWRLKYRKNGGKGRDAVIHILEALQPAPSKAEEATGGAADVAEGDVQRAGADGTPLGTGTQPVEDAGAMDDQ